MNDDGDGGWEIGRQLSKELHQCFDASGRGADHDNVPFDSLRIQHESGVGGRYEYRCFGFA